MSFELLRAVIQLIISVLFVVVVWQIVSIYREMSKLLAVIQCQGRMIYELHFNLLTALAQLGHKDKAIEQTEKMVQEIIKINDLLD